MGCLEEEKSFSPAATLTALPPAEVSKALAGSTGKFYIIASQLLGFLLKHSLAPKCYNIQIFPLLKKCCYEPGNVSHILLACLTW